MISSIFLNSQPSASKSQKLFSTTRIIFSQSKVENFWKQNTISCKFSIVLISRICNNSFKINIFLILCIEKTYFIFSIFRSELGSEDGYSSDEDDSYEGLEANKMAQTLTKPTIQTKSTFLKDSKNTKIRNR